MAPRRPGGDQCLRDRLQAGGQVQQRAGQVAQLSGETAGTYLEEHCGGRVSLVLSGLGCSQEEEFEAQREKVGNTKFVLVQ